MARHHVRACAEGARQGYRTARTELADALPPHARSAVLAAYAAEGRRLAAAARGVELVERALRQQAGDPGGPSPVAARRDPGGSPPGAAKPAREPSR
jgi:hypothetical protein